MTTEVVRPTSPAEAVEAFGDGAGVTVLAGGTIVVPEITYGRLKPEKVLVLGQAGLAGVRRTDGVVRIGAATPLSELEQGDEPLASVARHVADPEIRGQATIGGNLCASAAPEVPRGDLQAALLALDARVRSAGAGGEALQSVEEFLAADRPRLVLEIEYDDVERQASHAAVTRPHSHHYTILCACCVRSGDETRVAIGGTAPHAVRARSVEEALAAGQPPAEAAKRAVADIEPVLRDDAVASAWYRRRVVATVVARALAALEKETT